MSLSWIPETFTTGFPEATSSLSNDGVLIRAMIPCPRQPGFKVIVSLIPSSSTDSCHGPLFRL